MILLADFARQNCVVSRKISRARAREQNAPHRAALANRAAHVRYGDAQQRHLVLDNALSGSGLAESSSELDSQSVSLVQIERERASVCGAAGKPRCSFSVRRLAVLLRSLSASPRTNVDPSTHCRRRRRRRRRRRPD